MKKTSISIFIAAFLMASISGCNTFRGAGKDIESAGEGIQRTIDHND